MFERFTERGVRAVLLSQEEARREGHTFVGTEQLLLGLLAERHGIAAHVLQDLGITMQDIRIEIERINGHGISFSKLDAPFTPRAKRALENAIEEARKIGQSYVGTEHLLLAILNDETGMGVQILRHLGQDLGDIRDELYLKIGEEYGIIVTPGGAYFDNTYTTFFDPYEYEVPIEEYTSDLTEQAQNGKLDPVIGRDNEIDRVIQILARRRKNNPVLIGEPGVGKTAVAEGLAQRIVSGDIPEMLDQKQVLCLDIGLLLAGTKYRGEFEERLKKVMDLARDPENNMVLVIDEVHTLIGAGAAEGAVDAANILKPALARGELQCIGATTNDEYRKHIERDAALERRFQPVQVDEPSIWETVQILRCLRPRYEEHHCLKISDEALEAAASMGAQYIADRFLPDKAIDLIDEAGSRVRIDTLNITVSSKLKKYERELDLVIKAKNEAVSKQDFDEASVQFEIENEIRSMMSIVAFESDSVSPKDVEIVKKKVDPTVKEEHIATVVSAWTGIPVNKISDVESIELLAMEETLRSHIIGQEPAVSAVSRALRRARVGLRNPNRPIASFLFSGPTGVGKTELTKALALYFFGAEDAMVRLDMSEYMERHTVAKLIGPPPGYVGYSEGGQLTEAVRKKPYTVVLFDEIEKAHPDVFNLLLQIFEDGRLTDSKGRTIDFKNTMLILTSNIGAKVIEQHANKLDDFKGQFNRTGKPEDDPAYVRLQSLVNKELTRFFRPEFLNRLDEIIVFRHLSRDDLRQIADIMLVQLSDRARENGFRIKVSYHAKEVLIKEGYNPAYGARPLRRAIMKLLEDQLATKLLSKNIKPGSNIIVDSLDQEELTIVVVEPPSKEKSKKKR